MSGLSRRAALAVASLWFLACLFYGAPPQLFAALVQRGGTLQLETIDGSFWQGRAGEAYVILPDQQRIALGTLEWRLRPSSLLWLHPDAHVSTEYGEQSAQADVRLSPLGTVQLHNVRATAPLAALNRWLPLPAQGTVSIDLAELELSRSELRKVQGQLSWQQASWEWNMRWLALGDYRCELQMTKPAQVRCALQGAGALGIEGELLVDLNDKNYSLQAQLRPADSLPRDFREGLALVLGATRDASGQMPLHRDGRW